MDRHMHGIGMIHSVLSNSKVSINKTKHTFNTPLLHPAIYIYILNVNLNSAMYILGYVNLSRPCDCYWLLHRGAVPINVIFTYKHIIYI